VKRITIGIALSTMVLASTACSSDTGPLDGVEAITFLQRQSRAGVGDIFQYTSYIPGARIVKLSPPTADGQLTVLCCEDQGAEFADIDISAYDISFDAREILFSAKLSRDQRYGLFILTLDDGQVEQLPTDPNRDYVYPLYMPGDKIMFMTNAVVEEGAPQFRDEYERGVTTQVGTINRDGSGEFLAARNLSHRVFPTMLSDGRVMYTQWDHLGPMNAGHLVISNPDTTTVREAFGKEGRGVTNSYLKAVEVSPGRVVAIGSSRDRTLQSGAILDIRLGKDYTVGDEVRADREMSEANSSYRILTPQVPLGREPSSQTIGRYYDAFPLNAKEHPDLLVSWADGPVESGTLAAAGLDADFGIYLFDSRRAQRRPIYNDSAYWDVFPRVLAPRAAPPKIDGAGRTQYDHAALIGSMNVYDSSLDTFASGSIWGVRVIEGFSSEEGIPRDFGITEHEGAALLGVAEVREDGSWAALIPPNVPVHVQPVDIYGLSLRNEPVWFSGNPGESRFCGGCHEDRAATTVIQPGITQAMAIGPDDLMSTVGRFDRASESYGLDQVVGVPWDKALQPIFDANCTSCHDGTPGPANPSWTITDPESGLSQTWTFDLRGHEAIYGVGEMLLSGYSASHLSLMGPDMMDLEDAGLVIEGDIPVYIRPTDARGSRLIQLLNPPQLYPAPDLGNRAFAGTPHAVAMNGSDLTPDQYHLLILAADMGGQFYARENAPGNVGY
jgi:hypothetical protein